MIDKILTRRPNLYESFNRLPPGLPYLTTGLYELFHPDFRLLLKHERVINQFIDLENHIPDYDISSRNVLENQLVGKIFHYLSSDAWLGLFHNTKEHSLHVVYGKPGEETDIQQLREDMKIIGETLSCVDYSERQPFPLTTYPDFISHHFCRTNA